MIRELLKNNKVYYFLLAGIVAILIAVKLPVLHLPYYWDEAWSYSIAVYYMLNNGLSLLPDAMPPDISRGHPLLFYFLSSLWLKLVGSSTLAGHSFALLISIVLLIAVFFFCKRFFNKTIGITACIILLVQPVFLAQTSFLLPEILLALFTLLTFYFYFSNLKIPFVFFATLMLYTKETGVVAITSLIAFELVNFILKKQMLKTMLVKWSVIVIPLIIFFAYFLYQKSIYGWMFFPDHIGLMSFNITDILNKFLLVAEHFAVKQGRNILLFIFILTLTYLLLFRTKLLKKPFSNVLWFFIIYITGYLVFCALNFFTVRYLLCILPLFIILCTFLIYVSFREKKIIFYLLTTCIVASGVYNCFNRESNGDDSLGYSDAVRVHHQAIQYCEQNNFYDQRILTHFLMRVNLTHPETGYLSSGKAFSQVKWEFNKDIEVCIFSNTEYESQFDSIKMNNNLELLKRFELNHAWTEIYLVNKEI